MSTTLTSAGISPAPPSTPPSTPPSASAHTPIHGRSEGPLIPTWVLALLAWGCTAGTGMAWQGVYTDRAWLVPLLGTSAAVSLTALGVRALARSSQASPAWSLLGSLVGLVLGLTALTAAHTHALVGVIPTPASLSHLGALIRDGITALRNLHEPSPTSAALIVVTCLIVGVVGVATDYRAVTQHIPTMVGLFALISFLVPAMLHRNGLTVWGFILGATCYLLLVVCGRYDHPQASSSRAANSTGVIAIIAGVLAPVLLAAGVAHAFPQLSQGLIDINPEPKNRTVTVSNPILDLRQDLVQRQTELLFSYTSDEGTGQYLRLMGLDLFDGNQWNFTNPQVPEDQQIRQGMSMDSPAGLPTQAAMTTITMQNLDSKWLPLPYVATRAEVDPSWIYDRTTRNVFTKDEAGTTSKLGSFAVEHTRLMPSLEQLRAAGTPNPSMEHFLALPLKLSPVITRLASQNSAKATTNYDKALALQNWLRTFTYDVKSTSNSTGQDALEQFFSTRRGFCVHFASALAVMARTLGIPSRVAVGYLPGTQKNGAWVVTNRDAHAWPELYFEGVGWLPFEPTPANRAPLPGSTNQAFTGEIQPQQPHTPDQNPQPQPVPSEQPVNPSSGPSSAPAASSPSPSPSVPPNAPTPTSSQDSDRGWLMVTGLILLGLALLAGVLSLPRALAWWLRRRRWSQAPTSPQASAAAAAAQLRADSCDYGRPWHPQESPRQFTKRSLGSIHATDPEKAAGQRLCQLVEQWQYAPRISVQTAAAHDADLLRRGWHRQASRWQRLRATWLPASVWHALRHPTS